MFVITNFIIFTYQLKLKDKDMTTTVENSVKFTSALSLARIIKKQVASWADFAICKNEEGKMYLLGFTVKGFPSSNNDEVLYRLGTSISGFSANKIAQELEENTTITSGEIIL